MPRTRAAQAATGNFFYPLGASTPVLRLSAEESQHANPPRTLPVPTKPKPKTKPNAAGSSSQPIHGTSAGYNIPPADDDIEDDWVVGETQAQGFIPTIGVEDDDDDDDVTEDDEEDFTGMSAHFHLT